MTKHTQKTDKLGRPNAGKPQTKIDLAQLEKLCMMQCTDEEIAYFFGTHTKTIERRRKVEEFAYAMECGKAKGRISLRRKQWQLAEAGDKTMLIWLGKQYLGQQDRLEHTGANGGPIQISEIKVSFITPAPPTS